MSHRRFPASCGLIAGLLVAGCQGSQPTPPAPSTPPPAAAPADTAKKPPTDLEQLAERIVRQSAAVKEGELVLVSGGTQDQELLENIAVHIRRLGAFPMMSFASDRLAKRLFFDVPEKFDAQADTPGLKLAEQLDAMIVVDSSLDESALAGADPKRQAARANAGLPIVDLLVKRKVRQIAVGNGLYPTSWRAERLGMTVDQLAQTFWEGVNVDYSTLSARADQVRAVLAKGNVVHVKDANGSDLKVRIQGRPVFASDGIITDEEARTGGAGINVYLPAGEVFVAPVVGTAEGKIVRPREYFEGKEIQNLTLTFAAGKLTSMTGSGPGFEPLKSLYEAAGAGKELFAVVDLGINPKITLPASSVVGTWVPAGTVTLGMGNNLWAGGANNAPFGYFVSLPGTTVTLDDKVIVENGQLKI